MQAMMLPLAVANYGSMPIRNYQQPEGRGDKAKVDTGNLTGVIVQIDKSLARPG